MDTTKLDSAVGCTLRSQTDSKMSVFRVFVFSYLLCLSTPFFQKTSEVKKIPWTIFDLQYQFHINIFRHHIEIAFVKLRIKTDTWQVIDSAVCSMLQSLTQRWDAHRGVFEELLITWLRGGMHTVELDSAVGCTPRSLTPRCAAHRGARLRGRMHSFAHCRVRLIRKCPFFVFSYFRLDFFEKLVK